MKPWVHNIIVYDIQNSTSRPKYKHFWDLSTRRTTNDVYEISLPDSINFLLLLLLLFQGRHLMLYTTFRQHELPSKRKNKNNIFTLRRYSVSNKCSPGELQLQRSGLWFSDPQTVYILREGTKLHNPEKYQPYTST